MQLISLLSNLEVSYTFCMTKKYKTKFITKIWFLIALAMALGIAIAVPAFNYNEPALTPGQSAPLYENLIYQIGRAHV